MSFHLFNEALGKEKAHLERREFIWHVGEEEAFTRERERASFSERERSDSSS